MTCGTPNSASLGRKYGWDDQSGRSTGSLHMEVELKAEGRARALNNAVAITVVALSVFMAVSKIKDDNIVQAMQAAKADALDTWNEYQAERLKLHFAEQTSMM